MPSGDMGLASDVCGATGPQSAHAGSVSNSCGVQGQCTPLAVLYHALRMQSRDARPLCEMCGVEELCTPLAVLHRALARVCGTLWLEAAVFVFVCWLLARRARRPEREAPLSEAEVDMKCAAMKPEALVSPEDMARVIHREERTISFREGTFVTIDNKQASRLPRGVVHAAPLRCTLAQLTRLCL